MIHLSQGFSVTGFDRLESMGLLYHHARDDGGPSTSVQSHGTIEDLHDLREAQAPGNEEVDFHTWYHGFRGLKLFGILLDVCSWSNH